MAYSETDVLLDAQTRIRQTISKVSQLKGFRVLDKQVQKIIGGTARRESYSMLVQSVCGATRAHDKILSSLEQCHQQLSAAIQAIEAEKRKEQKHKQSQRR